MNASFHFGTSLVFTSSLLPQAAEDALLRVYLTKTPEDLLQLPSSTFLHGVGDVYRKGSEGAYIAPELVQSEIMYASSGTGGSSAEDVQ